MSELNQEFGDKPLVPTGISGDLDLVSPEQRRQERLKARLFMEGQRAEIVARVNDGNAIGDEEARLLAGYTSWNAHDLY